MRLACLWLAACIAPSHAATYTDAEIREMVERQRAFEKTVTRVVPPAVVEHIAAAGVALRSHGVDWEVERPAPPPDCVVRTQFMVFARGTPRDQALAYTGRINAGSLLNERAMIAMFYPSGRGEGCTRDRRTFEAVQARLVQAFQSYAP
jgi:hypothetical protein